MDDYVRKVTELEIRRLLLGLDKPEMAVQLELCCEEGGGINARTLRRWEARLHKPFRLFRRALCKYFKVDSVAKLGLGDTFEAARWWTWMTPQERTEEVDRRQLLGLAASGTVVLLLPVSKLTAAAQLLDGRAVIGAGDVETARRVATDIASAYLDTPSPDVRRAAKAHLSTLLDLLEHAQMTPATATALAGIASDAASLVGCSHLEAGRLAEADAWFEDAVKLARQADDRRLEALALANCAWPALYAPEPDRGRSIAALEAAAELQGFLPPAGRAWVFAYLAREHAALGHDLISGRFLERARAAAAWIQRADPGWGWLSTRGDFHALDGARFESFTGLRALRLGRPVEALELFDGALATTTDPVLRAAWQGRVTQASVALGDPDRACASAHAALDEAQTYNLGLYREWVRQTRRTFPKPWATLRPVIELDERLAITG